ncbi:MAG: methylated-DNA--[protein]-cysteine S-methyltransferase [Anaerolineaceae bacterium]
MNLLLPSLAYSRSDSSPIGMIEVLATSIGLFQVNLLGNLPAPANLNPNNLSESKLSRLALDEILEYLTGKRRVFDLPIDWSACKPFQKTALNKAQEIAFGEVLTYGDLAKKLNKAAASRAVGGAMARNPIPIVLPCHRVLASDGRLTGYSAADGIHTKKWLLELEGHTIVGEKLV